MSELQPRQERPILARIFVSPEERRLRAGWRLLLQGAMLLLLAGCLILPLFAVLVLLDPSVQATLPDLTPGYLLIAQVAETVALTASVFLARRFLDRRSIESLGLKLDWQALLDLVVGVAITLLQMSFIYVLMLGLGWLTFEGFAWEFDPLGTVITGVIIFLILFIFVGWNEELLFRGYHLQNLASGTNLFWGVILSSIIFGLAHLGNPDVTWAAPTGIFFAGVYLAYAYLRTKQLWLAIGLHIGWNFFEGVVFGFPVSGLDIYPLTRITVHGPEVWTGGAFGPEAGLIVLPGLALGAVLIYLYTLRRAK